MSQSAFYFGLALGFAIILFAMEGKEEAGKQTVSSALKKTIASPSPVPGTAGGGAKTCGMTAGEVQNQLNPAPSAPGMYPASSLTVIGG